MRVTKGPARTLPVDALGLAMGLTLLRSRGREFSPRTRGSGSSVFVKRLLEGS